MANGGVLVIDDFGRQQCTPRDLLNRWIVPLESRVDFLTLASGQKIELPFDVLVVFATNIKPSRARRRSVSAPDPLQDLRAGAHAVPNSRRSSRTAAVRKASLFDPAIVDHLAGKWHQARNIPFRGCHPRDLIKHALSLAEYLDRPRALTPELLDAACEGYFVHEESSVEEETK